MRFSTREVEDLVGKALDELPEEFAELLDNVAVMVEEEPSDEDLETVGMDPDDPDRDELLGLYHGVALPERDVYYSALPDRVVIYAGPIRRCCESRREAIEEIKNTVIHELGHYFGMEEEQMPY
jgi:predicted Zn-dependent protease with MMP-like domain